MKTQEQIPKDVPECDPDAELRTVLDTLETSLATPVIAGELGEWSEQMCCAWKCANEHIQRHLIELHPKQLKQILKEDPELSSQVEKLMAEDTSLEAERTRLARLTDELCRVAPLVEPNERNFQESSATLVNEGLAFISRFKKQKVAIDTWYQEAFTRDRGVAD